ncbi:response regulator [Bradyrhizobium japonicum]|jgi:DNA-binding response OmpR family regulator|uniref:Chemotaxis protein CheY n=1 Tax=Bradyrhizobium japonicum TaxID=375 RepID=A0A0A3Y0K5_BRAJP|nr:response regulator [Bradyrhizobium japonicum]KGT80232.1 chemotaxis protein CheY [Bradyrhizobium japonicum]MCS3894936.1 DNA-binding response OmpR family regulator [Bradyrhizobium japonicum USDA 38]MCS3947451.1 DNA-binding response OmpR family regulator [Bradyrhizobium japonicum]MCW2219718.1 DNA-binding response OmpR family regulator [Bradyrhizobium japonicum]MCW2344332.1 DNA-binding response OmpR family regulator [Bradyrhizobium japonicum]
MRRVLVVDDQKEVRAMVAIVLRVNRFDVVEAESGAAGLKAFSEGAFDAAIVDIFLADTSGVDVMVAIRERVPGFPIVAVSGMTALDFMGEAPGLADVICLQKPFRPNDLLQALHKAQAAAGGELSAAV